MKPKTTEHTTTHIKHSTVYSDYWAGDFANNSLHTVRITKHQYRISKTRVAHPGGKEYGTETAGAEDENVLGDVFDFAAIRTYTGDVISKIYPCICEKPRQRTQWCISTITLPTIF